MTRPNGLDVPAAACVLIAALPFEVTARPRQPIGKGDDFRVAEGPSGWTVRAGSGYADRLSSTSYDKTTLRDAILDALERRAVRHASAATEVDAEVKRLRLADRKRHAAEHAATLRADAATIRETVAALKAAWPEVTP